MRNDGGSGAANLPTPGEWLREQVPDAWHPAAEESNDRAIERDSRQPWPQVTDRQFLAGVEGYLRCLEPEQEARLSQDQLRRLTSIARRWTG
jgi:hypothetical protein